LQLTSDRWGKRIIGVTSGGSDTWDASLAELLKGKRVVVMPDADDAGAKFGEAVTKSLAALGIEFRVVTFDDVACKDVTDYLELHSAAELAERIGTDWVPVPLSVSDLNLGYEEEDIVI
jgi:DNA primase